MESLRGKLLLSSPSLVDPNFRKTVVLIAHHDEDGAMGLVLSRPSEVSAAEAVPLLEGLPGAQGPVFVGGPVQPHAFMVLAEFDDVEDSVAPIFERIGFMSADAEPEMLSIRRVRLFAGYAGWGAGQLEAELEEPAWIVVEAEPADPFADDPDALWREAVARAGGSVSLMKSMPYDPGLN
ncbi:MAG TPA: YqgE/AlgH family protein [Gaiellaceae bacterium]|nr:YqgE/AlgH family protein [Gaiellaceae bacterium]